VSEYIDKLSSLVVKIASFSCSNYTFYQVNTKYIHCDLQNKFLCTKISSFGYHRHQTINLQH